MKHLGSIVKRELLSYFRSPVAYVFIVIFLISTAGTTWYLGNFYTSDEATLESLFFLHTWL
jgi:ABC-2 type transport system permease protein